MGFTREHVEAEWRTIVCSPQAAAAIQRWEGDTRLAPFHTLDAILLATSIRSDPSRSEEILRALAERAPYDSIATRTLLQALLPGISAAARRYRNTAGNDAFSIAISEATLRIASGVPARRPGRVAANVIMDVRSVLSQMFAIKCPTEELREQIAVDTRSPSDEVIDMVTAANDAGVITQRAAELIVATRAYGFQIEEVAKRTGHSACGLRQLRRRSEARLLEWVPRSGYVCEFA